MQPVLCVPKACVTRALGGKLGHGIHPLPASAIQMTIEPHLQYRPLDELLEDGTFVQLMPYIVTPRTVVDPETKKVDIFLPTYEINPDNEKVKPMMAFTSHILKEDAAYGEEINPDTEEPDLQFANTVYKAIHRTLGQQMGVRVTDGNINHGEMQIAATQMVVVDHSNDASNKRLALLYLAMIPPGLDAYALETNVQNLGYYSVQTLHDRPTYMQYDGTSQLVIDQLMNNIIQHNSQV